MYGLIEPAKGTSGESLVVFCGSMDWLANIDGIEHYAERIWPLISQAVPDAKMRVVGRVPPAWMVKRIESLYPEWEFTGFVDDVRDHISGADAFVIPLRVGGGTRIKAFEAMAMGVPVVSTAIGIEGLPVEAGAHYLLGDDDEEFAEQVVSLLRDGSLRAKLSVDARRLVREQFDYRVAARVFEQICLDTVEHHRKESEPRRHRGAKQASR